MKKKLTSLVAFGLLCGFCCSSHAMNVAIPENPTAMRSLLVGTFQHQVMAVDNNKNAVFWGNPAQVAEAGDVQRNIMTICGGARLGFAAHWLNGANAALRINLSGSIAALLNCYQINAQGVLGAYAQVALGAGNPFLPAAWNAGSVMAQYAAFAPLFDQYVRGQQNQQDAFTAQGLTAFLQANVAANPNWTQEVVEYLAVQYISEIAEQNSLLGAPGGGVASGWDDAMIDILAAALR